MRSREAAEGVGGSVGLSGKGEGQHSDLRRGPEQGDWEKTKGPAAPTSPWEWKRV